jgi:hypothetical protein
MSTKPMVFIETGQRTTRPPAEDSTVLVLERPPTSSRARCDRPARVPVVSLSSPTPEPVTTDDGRAHRAYGLDSVYRAPGLALLAAVSILEGYKWLGVIPADRSPLSNLVFGRAGAAVFAILVLTAAALLARPGSEQRRSPSQRLVLLAAGAVALASVVFVSIHASAVTRLLGAADLALAAVVLGSLVAAERSRRRADRTGTVGSAVTVPPMADSPLSQ